MLKHKLIGTLRSHNVDDDVDNATAKRLGIDLRSRRGKFNVEISSSQGMSR